MYVVLFIAIMIRFKSDFVNSVANKKKLQSSGTDYAKHKRNERQKVVPENKSALLDVYLLPSLAASSVDDNSIDD